MEFIENSAKNGGGAVTIDVTNVSTTGKNTFILNDGTFTGNTAQNGGAINNHGSNLMVENSTLSNNSASESGGGINSGHVDDPGSSLMVKKSTFSGNSAGKDGGGINNIGSLMLDINTFSNNSAEQNGGGLNVSPNFPGDDDFELLTINSFLSNEAGQDGGAINNQGSNLMVENSTLSNNSASENGGGINSNHVDSQSGSLMVKNSTLSSNSAKNGGGIKFFTEDSDMGVFNSTFEENAALEIGGANDVTFKSIDFSDADITMLNVDGFGNSAGTGGFMGTLTATGGLLTTNSAVHGAGRDVNAGPSIVMRNSTISDNSAQLGGAIYNQCVNIKVDNSTISNNQATSGGGIASQGNELTTTILGNTIVANNVISDTTMADDLALFDGSTDSFSSGGYNLIGIMGPNIVFDGTGDLTNVADPKLGPLADNGGDTLTHALLPGSPAIDAGGDCDEPFDQRGVPRPQGPACDIGGYELIVEGYRIALPVIMSK